MKSKEIPACLIIDPLVSAKFLAEELLAAGIAPLALILDDFSDKAWLKARLNNAPFVRTFFGCPPNLPELLGPFDIKAVIYGREGKNIYLADQFIQSHYPQFANIGKSDARANKFEMYEACRKAGIQVGEKIRINQKQTLSEEQIKVISTLLPVVIKPTNSSGSLDVRFCDTLDEIRKTLVASFEKNNVTSLIEEVVLQEKHIGIEYFVDTVSWNGKHYVTGVFCYRKEIIDGRPIYRWLKWLDTSTNDMNAMVNYVQQCLDAVGIHFGFAHTEIIMTSKGPRLVEINPRISGASGFPNIMSKMSGGLNQVSVLVNFIKDSKLESCKHMTHTMTLIINHWQDAIEFRGLNEVLLKKISSYSHLLNTKPIGSLLKKPENLHDSVAFILLKNSDMKQLEEDALTICDLEERGELFL